MRGSGGQREKFGGRESFPKGGVNYIYLPPTPCMPAPLPMPVGVPPAIIPTLGRGVIYTQHIERPIYNNRIHT